MKTIIGTKRILNNAMECPTETEIALASAVLHRQMVSIYQPLYADGLAEPGNHGGRFHLYRSREHSSMIEVHVNPKHESYTFLAKGPEGVLEKCKLILMAIEAGMEKTHNRACCPLAVVRSCVCEISFECPIHGVKCYGSHE